MSVHKRQNGYGKGGQSARKTGGTPSLIWHPGSGRESRFMVDARKSVSVQVSAPAAMRWRPLHDKIAPANLVRPPKPASPPRTVSVGNTGNALAVPRGQPRQSGEPALAAPLGFSDTLYPQSAANEEKGLSSESR